MVPKRRADLLTRTIDGEVVILDRAGGHVHQLNPTASQIWEECDGTRTVEEIAASVAGRFESVSADTALSDVRVTIVELVRLGLLVTPEHEESP